ncbi:hypothetical protein CCH79_00002079 [Gambusia affinis]|uniref:Hexosyltransferase n=1 Tax=Gambusia affinis TaxID=33528 RepID=A0A315VHF3_GAMAF|nr:hypothetical protein CCH79_00002079 [Gambusia affinis]
MQGAADEEKLRIKQSRQGTDNPCSTIFLPRLTISSRKMPDSSKQNLTDLCLCVTGPASRQITDKTVDLLYYRHCRHFPMLLDVPDKCGGTNASSDVFLLLVIKSSAVNYDRREVLRKTWAEERLSNGVLIRRIFISGTMGTGYEKKRLNQLLKLEQSKHNDILQWDFNDTFYNLTLKQILFLEWMERNCPRVHFLFNGDDDVFANTDNMVLYLQNFELKGGRKHLFAGHLIYGVGPIRSRHSKYYVPKQLYESKLYPAYCGGGGFLLSGYTALVIYTNSHSIPLLPIDDVYMGMCLAQAGFKPEHHLGATGLAPVRLPHGSCGNNVAYHCELTMFISLQSKRTHPLIEDMYHLLPLGVALPSFLSIPNILLSHTTVLPSVHSPSLSLFLLPLSSIINILSLGFSSCHSSIKVGLVERSTTQLPH